MTVPPLPVGFGISLDPDTRRLDERTLFGGSPGRVLRLSPAGVDAFAGLTAHGVTDAATGMLARRLTDAGVAHPCPPPTVRPEVTVIVPVHDRASMMDRCLTGLGNEYRVIVVDDASADQAGVAAVAARHGAQLVRRPVNGGPAAARNTGLALVGGGIVALLDSDCVPDPSWIAGLLDQFADPLVAAVAPRIVALPSRSWAGRYGAAAGSLDLGGRTARVVPASRVSYVPTAALLLRHAALSRIVRPEFPLLPGESGHSGRTMQIGEVFDESMRVGEDVDLVWRLHTGGWRIRYLPTVQVGHAEPDDWPTLLRRRFSYGTSAGPLARRHPRFMSPLVLFGWPTLTVAALLSRRPLLAGVGFAGACLSTLRTLRRNEVPTGGVVPAMRTATLETWLGIGRYSSQFAAPVLLAVLAGRHRGRALAAGSLLLGPPTVRWLRGRPDLDPARFVLGNLADDLAYGAGVYTGSLHSRTARALLPKLVLRPLRIDRLRRH